ELAAGKKLIVKVDDIDRAGEGALDLLVNLSSDPNVKIIASYEKDLPVERIRKGRKVTEIKTGLNKDETSYLIAREISERISQTVQVVDIDNTFIEKIYAQSGGNPLYVKEALRVLLDTKKLNKDIGEWSAADTSIPTKFDEIVSDRIRNANLRSEERKVLEYAAAMGSEFDINFVYDATGVSRETDAGRRLDMEESLVEAIDSLTDKGLLKKRGKKMCVDSHVGRVVYESISPEKRKIIHNKIANTLDKDIVTSEIVQEQLIEHYGKSGRTPEVLEKLITYASALSDACDVSSEKYMDTAIEAIRAKEERCIATDEDVKLKFDLLQKKQSIIAATRGADEAIAFNDKAVNDAAVQFQKGRVDRSTVARFRLNSGNMKLNKEDYIGAAEDFARAQAILEIAADKLGLAKCYAGLGIAYMQLGKEKESHTNIDRALGLVRKCTEEESKEIETTLYYYSCLNAVRRGNSEEAIGDGMTALQIAKNIPNGVGAIHRYNADIALSKAYESTGDVDTALSYLNGAIAVAKDHNYLKLEARARETAGKKLLELGKNQPNLRDEGLNELGGALKVYRKIGDAVKIDELTGVLGMYKQFNSENPVVTGK
ncbi:MAG: hypothetical protein PHU12_03600, partial [Candidatus Aenigmarchaeota archaeon]|nr:hypothetical protein [Candidatus Aenigmarchaeota archaeon]